MMADIAHRFDDVGKRAEQFAEDTEECNEKWHEEKQRVVFVCVDLMVKGKTKDEHNHS